MRRSSLTVHVWYQDILAISLAILYPTMFKSTHTLVNAYKNLIAVSLATDYTFEVLRSGAFSIVASVVSSVT